MNKITHRQACRLLLAFHPSRFGGSVFLFSLLSCAVVLCSAKGLCSGKEDVLPGRVSSQPLSFGSEIILHGCWSYQELQGKPEELAIFRSRSTRSDPPQRVVPLNRNPELPQKLRGSVRSVVPYGKEKLVALTFDLCESTGERSGYDAGIIDILRNSGTKATFFAGGKWMASHPERTMQLMADPLFELGSHGWSHANLRVMKGPAMEAQIQWTQAQYELLWEELKKRACLRGIPEREMEKVPRLPLSFRFPFGTCNPEVLDFLAQQGLPAIQWDVVTGDPAPGQSAGAITQTVLSKTRSGSIVIAHANGRGHGTAAAMGTIIPELKRRGFQFVTISELLRDGEPVATAECYELKPGDNKRYDKRERK